MCSTYYALLISNIIRFSSFFVLTRIITVLYSLDPFHKPVCNSCILVKPKIESLQIFMCLNEETSETFYPKPTFYLEYLNVLSLKVRKIIFHDRNIIFYTLILIWYGKETVDMITSSSNHLTVELRTCLSQGWAKS